MRYMPITIFFLGSFQHYSAIILAALLQHPQLKVTAVITTPPAPMGKAKTLTANPVQQLAEQHHLSVFTPSDLNDQALAQLPPPPDLLVTAGYGKLLPLTWLQYPRHSAINIHFSLLPKYRGANPAEWALLRGETHSGVTVMEMSPQFDTGGLIAQLTTTLTPTDTRVSVYQRLYELAASHISEILPSYLETKLPPQPQPPSPTPYARRLYRADGQIQWSGLAQVMTGQSVELTEFSPFLQEILRWQLEQTDTPTDSTTKSATLTAPPTKVTWAIAALILERASRALAEFPTLWTVVPTKKGPKRMKIIKCNVDKNKELVLEQVQVEGYQPASWANMKTLIS